MFSAPEEAAIKSAVTVLDDHIAALNARDEKALIATLHFRTTGGK